MVTKYFLCNIIKKENTYISPLVTKIKKKMKRLQVSRYKLDNPPEKLIKRILKKEREIEIKTFKYPIKSWSAIYYPSKHPHEIALVKVTFFENCKVNKEEIIKEIKSKKDWEEINKEYNFSKDKL